MNVVYFQILMYSALFSCSISHLSYLFRHYGIMRSALLLLRSNLSITIYGYVGRRLHTSSSHCTSCTVSCPTVACVTLRDNLKGVDDLNRCH